MIDNHNNSSFQVMIQQKLALVLNKYPLLIKIVHDIHTYGGRALLVGGSPRDLILNLPIKDLDIEIHGLSLKTVENILRAYGPVNIVGKSFGVLRVGGMDADWSLPRIDTTGRKPLVSIDPYLSLKEAFIRRDLTINAMGIDLVTYEFIDPFNGLQDIKNKILRVPDADFFIQDPLRFYRVMQFIGRFDMQPDQELMLLCTSMNISSLSIERVEQEFEKLLLKSKRPSLGIRWLHECKRLTEILPEIAALIKTPQNPAWHPEGSVFEHTMQALDASATYSYSNNAEKLICIYAALCHDIGKATTTKQIDGVWRSLHHDQVGAQLVPVMLRKITLKKDLIKSVQLLVKYHMVPAQFVSSNAQDASYKRLALKLSPYATLQMLGLLFLADRQGRNPESHEPLRTIFPNVTLFIQRAQQAQVFTCIEKPILTGKDLLDHVSPGPQMGILLKQAYSIQLNEGITDKNELKKRIVGQ